MSNRGWTWTAALAVLGACTPHYQVTIESTREEPEPAIAPAAPADAPPATPPNPWLGRELPFEPSDADRPFLGTGFTGYAAVPAETGYTQGVRVAGVQPQQALAIAGMQDGDIIVSFAGQTLDGPQDELIQQLRDILNPMAPDTLTSLAYWREGQGVRDVELWLGRSPPDFAQLDAPASFLDNDDLGEGDAWLNELVAEAVALDGGAERLADVRRRQRERFAKTDPLRLAITATAQLHPTAQDFISRMIAGRIGRATNRVAYVAVPDWGGSEYRAPGSTAAAAPSWDAVLDGIESDLTLPQRMLADQVLDWTPEERTWLAANLHHLSDRVLVQGEYIYGDEDVARERANRRIVALLTRVDRGVLAIAADYAHAAVEKWTAEIARLAEEDGRDGLLASRDTPGGRIEIWGGGRQTHKTRCLFRYDHGGNDTYLDTAGRADLDQPISINVDHAGDDVYGATAPFCQGAALGGIGILVDLAGDDQYLAQQWSQGAAVAGVGILDDRAGNDTYRGREACQGAALVGGANLRDDAGDDVYSGDRFCQGVGFPAGVGALHDGAGADRYSCTGRYPSEYGEDGLFSGWGQGVGFGFRGVASGGIGVLHDLGGDDVYEAGNFSQGGGYFFAWGILRDDAGSDRYIGSRYAQGYAAHQAAGTFVDGGGDDLYQSYSTVAQGLSWDETSVFFRDRGGNDRYETGGFSLASAAHNGMVIFVDDGGDDTYADLPAKASSNTYHGGWSFALFVDRAGTDHYANKPDDLWNGRAFWRHDGAYLLDLDGDRPLSELVREPESHD